LKINDALQSLYSKQTISGQDLARFADVITGLERQIEELTAKLEAKPAESAGIETETHFQTEDRGLRPIT